MLKDKTALITGGSRGIGRSVAQEFATNGCFVGINYHSNKKAAEQTLHSLEHPDRSGMILQADISVVEDIKRMVSKLVSKRKHIDILVHNAGIYIRHKFSEITLDDWSRVLDVNLHAAFILTQEVIPFMPQNGRVIFVSSQLALKGTSHGADYAASKAGLLGLMRSLSLELAQEQILVNAIAPGTIDTDMISNYSKEQRQIRIQEIPLQRLGDPKEVAYVCLFLASELGSYITGETINVNGGLYIH
ncbi:MAG: SDR family NAD(P)-dependent oxidoreductase [Candidatus Thermoplasmatota archaeon]|nr:SDR family NAD(P)-dependent oxidoreductase [Candidatus Thermoplasmatota archaeon]